jgi:hypothetical protein
VQEVGRAKCRWQEAATHPKPAKSHPSRPYHCCPRQRIWLAYGLQDMLNFKIQYFTVNTGLELGKQPTRSNVKVHEARQSFAVTRWPFTGGSADVRNHGFGIVESLSASLGGLLTAFLVAPGLHLSSTTLLVYSCDPAPKRCYRASAETRNRPLRGRPRSISLHPSC